jgi:hypothetical protein
MNDERAIYLTRLQSIRRGVREGWYAVDTDGELQSGPFATREALVARDVAGTVTRV